MSSRRRAEDCRRDSDRAGARARKRDRAEGKDTKASPTEEHPAVAARSVRGAVRLRSAAGAEWVSAPTLITSTPGTARNRAASRTARRPKPPRRRRRQSPLTARADADGVMLSRRMTSAPARTAAVTSASVLASTSILARCVAPALASFTAFASEPAAAMWLSLIRTCSPSDERWLMQPPHRTAYFSSARKPGVVFRVSAMRTPGARDRIGKRGARASRCPRAAGGN